MVFSGLMNERSTGAVVSWRAAKDPRVVGFAAAALALVSLYWLRLSGFNGGSWIDLRVYERGAQAIVTGTPLYEGHRGVLPFTYSPFAALVFTPLHFISATGARWVVTFGSLVSYLVVVGVCGWRLRLPWRFLAFVALAGMALEPFMRTILLGQVNLYLMAAVVIDCLVLRSPRRGWLVGLAAGIKVVPGVFVLYFVLQRDWRSALRAVSGFVLTVVIGALVAPQDSLRYWRGGLFGISHWGPVAVVDAKNQSLVGQLARISHNPSPFVATTLVLALAGLALGVAAAHRQLKIGDDVAALTAVAIGGLLASPLSWTHHWLWAVPAAMVLVSRRQWVFAGVLAAVFAAGSARAVTLQPSQESLTLLQQVACGTYVAAGMALLAVWAFTVPLQRLGRWLRLPVAPGPRGRGQHEDRDRPVRLDLVVGIVGEGGNTSLPPDRLLLPGDLTSGHRLHHSAVTHLDPGVGHEVVVPDGILRRTAH
jgi:alpha-1,2-mannosyltransferase